MSIHSPEGRDFQFSEEIPKPVQIILNNRSKLAESIGVENALYTPPAYEHYLHLYPWDSASAAIILNHYGYRREAITEVFSIFKGQKPDGKVPNIQRIKGFRSYDPELLTFSSLESADYSQPPIWAMPIKKIYDDLKDEDEFQAKLFLSKIYPYLTQSLMYFVNERQFDGENNPLIFLTHRNESGRDFDPSLNGFAPYLPINGENSHRIFHIINSGTGYLGNLALAGLNKLNGWDPNKIRKYYRPLDPMFNSIYVHNMRLTAYLAEEIDNLQDAEFYRMKAAVVENKIINNLWQQSVRPNLGAFMVNNVNGTSEDISIGSLGPLLLENLPEDKLESILELMDRYFNTKYTLPTVATDSPHYDPDGKGVHRVWGGPIKIIGNYLIDYGLRMQIERATYDLSHRSDLINRCLDWSQNRIIPDSKLLIEQGQFESYSPNSGKPQRTNTVRNFVWSGLAATM